MARLRHNPNIQATALSFLFFLITVTYASLPFQQSPPPPQNAAPQPDPMATQPTTIYSAPLFSATSSTPIASSITNQKTVPPGAIQATPVPGSEPGPGNVGGHGIIAGSLTTSPATMTGAPSPVKSGSIGLSMTDSMSMTMSASPSKTGALQTGGGSKTALNFGVMSCLALGWWIFG